jgi:hypothetical protein
MTESSSSKTAWVQLYEARRMVGKVKTRSPGRPPAPIPRRKVGLTLSQGEIHELGNWQERFSSMLKRKVSIGETVGILTRICSARLATFSENGLPSDLDRLVDMMITNAEKSTEQAR